MSRRLKTRINVKNLPSMFFMVGVTVLLFSPIFLSPFVAGSLIDVTQTTNRSEYDSLLRERITSLISERESNVYIVLFDSLSQRTEALPVLETIGNIRIIFDSLPIVSLETFSQEISRLEKLGKVIRNERFQLISSDPLSMVGSNGLIQQYDQATNAVPLAISADDLWDKSESIRGNGVKIAILDSGVDKSHPAIEVAEEKSFVFDYASYYRNETVDDFHGHGTHVAGIAASRGINGRFLGVAPEAQIMNYKCADLQGQATIEGVTAAINEAVKDDAHVISISLGMGSNATSEISLVANEAVRAGTIVVVSAGNDGPGYYSMSSPASASLVISVGAWNESSGNVAEDAAAWNAVA